MENSEVFLRRIEALRKEMHKQRLDVFASAFPPTLHYLCGYTGSNGLLIVRSGVTEFLTDFRYQESIRSDVSADRKTIAKGSLYQAAVKKKMFARARRIGIEKDHMVVTEFDALQTMIDPKLIVTASGIVENLRSVKDDWEIRELSAAFRISDMVFRNILEIVKPGMREIELSAEISYLHKKFGAATDAFDVIVTSGSRGSLPHGTASLKRLRTGEFITLDFGCVVRGYHSDMTRTICLGTPSRKMKSVYQIVLDAQQKACDAVRNGVPAKKLDGIARGYITRKGYGKYFGHSLGHGVGLEIHELPRIAPKSKDHVKTGNVITIEPGIYLPGEFGIRIEDTVVVRRNGCEILTRSDKQLIVL